MPASAGRTLLWTLVGAIAGTALGELLSRLLPSNGFTRFLTASVPLGTSHPFTLDLRILEITFGALLRLNLLGVLGAIVILFASLRRP